MCPRHQGARGRALARAFEEVARLQGAVVALAAHCRATARELAVTRTRLRAIEARPPPSLPSRTPHRAEGVLFASFQQVV